MSILNTADALKIGAADVVALHLGSTQIWQQGGGGFSPADLSPAAWYEPSDLSTLFQDTDGTVPAASDGDTISRINDKSGNGIDQILFGTQEPLTLTIGDSICATASTSPGMRSASGILTGQNIAVCMAVRNSSSQNGIWFSTNTTHTDDVAVVGVNPQFNPGWFIGSYAWNVDVFSAVEIDESTPATRVITALIDLSATSSADGLKIRVNGSEVGRIEDGGWSSPSGSFSPSEPLSLAFGCLNALGNGAYRPVIDGALYSLVVLNDWPSSDDLALLETYVGARAGISI